MPQTTENESKDVEHDHIDALATHALLAHLQIKRWTAIRKDNEVSEEAAKIYNANADRAGRYEKNLLDCPELSAVTTAGNSLRNAHREMTLPWDEAGYRLLPVTLHDKYVQRIEGLIEEYVNAREALLRVYTSRVDEAKRVLGTMWRAEDYPTPDQVRQTIAARYTLDEVPRTDNFVARVTHSQAIKLQEDINNRSEERTNRAISSLLELLIKTTENAVERLSDPVGEGRRQVIREAMIRNLNDVTAMIPHMNLVGDKGISELATKLQAAMQGIEAADLKVSSKTFDAAKKETVLTTAQEVSNEARELLAGYGTPIR